MHFIRQVFFAPLAQISLCRHQLAQSRMLLLRIRTMNHTLPMRTSPSIHAANSPDILSVEAVVLEATMSCFWRARREAETYLSLWRRKRPYPCLQDTSMRIWRNRESTRFINGNTPPCRQSHQQGAVLHSIRTCMIMSVSHGIHTTL